MNNPTPSGIYKLTFGGEKTYVGSAVNLTKRRNNHLYELRKGKHPNVHLQRAWAKYGEDAFTFEVLEYVPVKEDLIACEQRWIDTMKAGGVTLYNIKELAGNRLGVKQTPESLAKMVKSKTGTKLSEETKKKLSEVRKGRVLSEEHRAALSEAAKKRKVSPETRAKISASRKLRITRPETLEKMRQAQLGKKLTEEHKRKIGLANRNRTKNVEPVPQ